MTGLVPAGVSGEADPTASPPGPLTPVMKSAVAFHREEGVVRQCESEESEGAVQPGDEAGVNHDSSGGVIFTHRSGAGVTTKRVLPDNTRKVGLSNPVMKLALVTAPVVSLYWPTLFVVFWTTYSFCARRLLGMAQSTEMQRRSM